MPERPTVSVVMCTFNGALFVEEQLRSVISQTYPLNELLIFDDASTDGTPTILHQFAANHPSVKVNINPQNIGFTQNFEQAVKAASGDVIAICDQDDIWVECKIEKMLAAWRPESPLIYCGALLFSTTFPKNISMHPLYRQFEGTDARKIFLRNTVSGHALMIKKKFLPLVFPFKEDVMYDWMMAVTAAYNGGVQFYPEVLVFQREHSKNATLESGKNLTETQRRKAYKEQVIAHCRAFQQIPQIPEDQRKFAETMTALFQQSLSHSFYSPLYNFVFKHRLILFSYKRKAGFLSYLKHSFKRTLN